MNDVSAVLRCNDLSKSFHDGEISVDVLKQVNLTINSAETVAIMGASGSGKSTLLHCLGGLDKPTSGEVFVEQQSLNKMSEAAKSECRNHTLGFVYQFHHLLPEFNALENVMMPLLIRGDDSAKTCQQAALDIIEQVGLSHRAKHRVNELSGGERQRIAIARALVTKPKCLLADEPTGNLDQHTADKITEMLLQLNQKLGTAFVIVTHNHEMAKHMQRQLQLVDGVLAS
ncbi:MAG: lipoprotein-releasing ABC transporter ATP-binding protein LolD [Coxiellaceae bacterium]|nr:lipoprotein-releasing ABC transporter ATP-binding protein LolD [Coxiellaceae bacterium]